MSPAGRNIILNKFLIICFLLFSGSTAIFCSPSGGSDFFIIPANSNTDTIPKDSVRTDHKVSFYKSDSVFSMHSDKGYIPSLLHNFGAQATAPFHFTKKQWLYTGGAIAITGVLFALDGSIDAWAKPQKQDHHWIAVTSPVATEFGNRYGALLVIAIGSASAVFGKEKGVETSLLATQAMITSGVWVRVMKLLTARERPKGAYIYSHNPSGEWYGPFAQFEIGSSQKRAVFAYDAFPSGHTAIAFAIATVFASRYNDTKVVPVLCYSAASIVGVTRLIEHEHWASDVFVGGLIGYLCGKQVVKHFNETHPGNDNASLLKHQKKTELNFITSGNQVGISLKW